MKNDGCPYRFPIMDDRDDCWIWFNDYQCRECIDYEICKKKKSEEND